MTELKTNTNLPTDVDFNDPDMLMLLHGGYMYYDSNGNLLRAMSLTVQPTQFPVEFGAHDELYDDDVKL